MKVPCDSSTEESCELGKRSFDELLNLILPESTVRREPPGHDCVYLYSTNYQSIDKLVNKYGLSLALTPSELEEERKMLWQELEPPYFSKPQSAGTSLQRPLSKAGNKRQDECYSPEIRAIRDPKPSNKMQLRQRPRARVRFSGQGLFSDSED